MYAAGVIREAKVAAGGVATVPWKLSAVERHLIGERPSDRLWAEAASHAADGARPLEHNRFKVELLKRTVERQLRIVGENGMSPQPQAAVGAPLSRVDGRLKVTGKAEYAAEHDIKGAVHAVIVDASIGRGRIRSIDTRDAEKHAGVLRVIHHGNAPKLPYRDNAGSNNPAGRRLRVFQDDRVLFHGQPVAVVVATTLEAAQHGASLVKVRYDAEKPSTDLTEAKPGEPTPYARGDAEAGLRSSAVRLDLTYELARNHHNPMEPHATIARWDGNRLTVWDKTQWVMGTHDEIAAVFDLPADAVRVINPFVGGGFGSGLRCWPHTIVAALAARVTRRPVKLVLSRKQMYFGTGFRPSYEYRLRLGSDRRGRLNAAIHDIDARDLVVRDVLRGRHGRGPDDVQHAQRPPGVPAGAVGREHPDLDARARLRARVVRDRVGHGRARARARHRPDRAAPAQRTGRGRVDQPAVLHPATARVLHGRRPRVRLAPPQPRAALHAGREPG